LIDTRKTSCGSPQKLLYLTWAGMPPRKSQFCVKTTEVGITRSSLIVPELVFVR